MKNDVKTAQPPKENNFKNAGRTVTTEQRISREVKFRCSAER
jgi:hypothetical protein